MYAYSSTLVGREKVEIFEQNRLENEFAEWMIRQVQLQIRKKTANTSIYESTHSYNTIVQETISDSAFNYIMKKSKKDFTHAKEQLEVIEKLQYNWNDNDAEPFPESLIKKCQGILDMLPEEPFISPTACGAIQLEYEKANGEYIEFEVYEKEINTLTISEDGTEETFKLRGNNQRIYMKNMVDRFYGRNGME